MSGALEFSRQWDRILRAGAIRSVYVAGPVTRDDFVSVVGAGFGPCRVIVEELHSRTGRDSAVVSRRKWMLKDPLVHPCKWLRPDVVPFAAFVCSVVVSLLRVGRVCWQILGFLIRSFGRFGFFFSVGQVGVLQILDGLGWREMMALPLPWFDKLA